MANGGIIGTVNNPTSSTATGVWQQEEQYEAKVTGTWPQRALFTTKSARFNTASTDYLQRNMSNTGNLQAWTVSTWVKRSTLSGQHMLFASYADSNNSTECFFEGNGSLNFRDNESGSFVFQKKTTQLFQDTSAWYHLVMSSSAGAQKIYVNGVEVTSFAVNNNGSGTSTWNGPYSHSIGANVNGGSDKLGGYLSELISVDGQTLTPSSFGVANSDGVWTPIPYTGTYGTNGFNLQFENAAALGTDSSSNGLNFTANNLTSIDQSTDYPEVNFATYNPLYKGPAVYSEGNLTSTISTGSDKFGGVSTIGVISGKWYAEFKALSDTSNDIVVGIFGNPQLASNNNQGVGKEANSIGYRSDGQKGLENTFSSYGASYTTNDIIGVALDLTSSTKTITFYKNGSSQSAITISLTPVDGVWFMASNSANGSKSGIWSANFGSAPYAISSGNADGNGYGNFEYAVPSGYYSLNTKNLGEFG